MTLTVRGDVVQVGPVEYGIGAIGAGLIIAGILNVTPLGVVRRALGPTERRHDPVAPIHAGGSSSAVPGAVSSGGTADEPGTPGAGADGPLVTYRNPVNSKAGQYSGIDRKMTAPTRDGLEAWGRAYGQRIVITDGYRTPAEQAGGYADDPGRYAPADKSWHVKGKAVDVHLAAMGADNALGLARLHAAGRATGWCFHGRSGPMHASFGGCG